MRRSSPRVLAAATLVAGCTTDGRAVAPNDRVSMPLDSGDLDTVLLTPRQLSDIVGAARRQRPRPRRHRVGGVLPDAGKAAKAFTAAIKDLGSCNGSQVHDLAGWTYAVNDVTPDTVRWGKQQAAIPMPWVCSGQARVRDNAIIEALVCQGDDAGSQSAQTILDRMSAPVWELSAS